MVEMINNLIQKLMSPETKVLGAKAFDDGWDTLILLVLRVTESTLPVVREIWSIFDGGLFPQEEWVPLDLYFEEGVEVPKEAKAWLRGFLSPPLELGEEVIHPSQQARGGLLRGPNYYLADRRLMRMRRRASAEGWDRFYTGSSHKRARNRARGIRMENHQERRFSKNQLLQELKLAS